MQTTFVASQQRANTLSPVQDVILNFPPLRKLVDEAKEAVSSWLRVDDSVPRVFIVRQGADAHGGTNYKSHRDDDIDPSFKATVVVKLTDPSSTFRIVGANKHAHYPEGAGWGVMFPAESWHVVMEESLAVKLTIHLRGEYKFEQREVRRDSLAGRVRLGGALPEGASSATTGSTKALLPFSTTQEAVQHINNIDHNFYDLFNLKQGCGMAKVLSVYRAGSKYLHHDKVSKLDDELLKQAAKAAWLKWDTVCKRLVDIEQKRADRATRGGEAPAYVEKAPACASARGEIVAAHVCASMF